jgi:hypothetical protein
MCYTANGKRGLKGRKRGGTYGFLAAELVTGKAEDDELVWVRGGDLLVQRLEALVLGREAAFRGRVDDQDDLSLVGV